jgi:excisionase family DNA binding protein
MLTVKEVADELHMSRPSIYRLINEHKLPAVVVSGVKLRILRIEREALDKYKAEHGA